VALLSVLVTSHKLSKLSYKLLITLEVDLDFIKRVVVRKRVVHKTSCCEKTSCLENELLIKQFVYRACC